MPNNNFDAWSMAGTEYVSKREYYGQILVDCVAMVFPGPRGSKERPVPYDPEIHKGMQPFTPINMTLDPLPEMQLSRPVESNWSNFDQDWNKISMPSIRQLGFVTPDGRCDLRKFHKSYIKLEYIPGFRKNRDPEKDNYKTMKFSAAYADEKACRAAYLEENSANAEFSAPVPEAAPASEDAKASAMIFIKAVIKDSRSKGKDVSGILEDVRKFLSENAGTCAGLAITSPEVIDAINEPPF